MFFKYIIYLSGILNLFVSACQLINCDWFCMAYELSTKIIDLKRLGIDSWISNPTSNLKKFGLLKLKKIHTACRYISICLIATD